MRCAVAVGRERVPGEPTAAVISAVQGEVHVVGLARAGGVAFEGTGRGFDVGPHAQEAPQGSREGAGGPAE